MPALDNLSYEKKALIAYLTGASRSLRRGGSDNASSIQRQAMLVCHHLNQCCTQLGARC
jgi:hypothetical protein